MKWRLMLVPARRGAENMARDTGLMERARETGETVLSVYSWQRPTLSLGRNQTAARKYNLSEIASRGFDVVRRPTGGRALLHNREVTYSVTAPILDGDSLNASYERINALLLDGLAALGVVATVANPVEAPLPPAEIPCFAQPSKGELVSAGRKLVGSAQTRENGALLQHGSILIGDDQSLIAAVSLTPPVSNAVPAATLSSALGRTPEISEVADALFAAVRRNEDPGATPLDECDVSDRTARHLARYESEWWTWRR